MEYGIFGEGSHISTNQKRENDAYSLLSSDWFKIEPLPRKYRTLSNSEITSGFYSVVTYVSVLDG